MIELAPNIKYYLDIKGTVMLDITDDITPAQSTEINGVMLYPKSEYHCTLFVLRKSGITPEYEQEIINGIRTYLETHLIRFISLKPEHYVCSEGDEQTLIAPVELEGFDELYQVVKRNIPDLPRQFLHVTLLKNEASRYGIGIASQAELEARCTLLKASST